MLHCNFNIDFGCCGLCRALRGRLARVAHAVIVLTGPQSVAWDEFLGGQAFDSRLAKRFGNEFNAKSQKQNDGVSVFDQPRTMARLRIQAKKVKEILSANRETPVIVRTPVRFHHSWPPWLPWLPWNPSFPSFPSPPVAECLCCTASVVFFLGRAG